MLRGLKYLIPLLTAALLAAGFTLSAQNVKKSDGGAAPPPAVQGVGTMGVVGDSSTVVVQLNNATVSAKVEPVKIVEDTVEYNPAAFRLPEDAMLEDLLSKIPGLEINGGTVTLHGRQVQELLIDGQRFFSGNVKVGLQNLSADMVAKVRAYERESDFTRTTGIDDGEQVPVLDLKIKKHMMDGWRGNVGGGYGWHNRYAARANANKIKKDEQTTVLANFNNLNGKININNASRTQLGGGSSGDRDYRELGFNLSRRKKKVKVNANVHYGGNNRNYQSDSRSENLYSTGITHYHGAGWGDTHNENPTASTNVEWNIDRNNLLIFKTNLKFNENFNLTHNSTSSYAISGKFSNRTNNSSFTRNPNLNCTFNVQYTHRFNEQKRGRSLTVSAYGSVNDTWQRNPQIYETYKDSLWFDLEQAQMLGKRSAYRKVYLTDDNRIYSSWMQLAYNEPLKKGFHIQALLLMNYTAKRNTRNVYNVLQTAQGDAWQVDMPVPAGYMDFRMPELSSDSRFDQFMPKATLNMRLIRKRFNLTVGVVLHPEWNRLDYVDSLGRDTVVRKSSFNVAPNLSITYRPTKTERLQFTYRSWYNSPSLYNLVPVSNGTNPLYLHYGNENLVSPYVHRLELSYNRSNLKKQSSLIVNLQARITQHQVCNRTEYRLFDAGSGTVAMPFNIEGNWNASGSMAYTKSLNSYLSLVQHASASFNNNKSFLYDSQIKDKSQRTKVNTTRRLMVKESFDMTFRNDWLELIGNINGDFTMEQSVLRPEMTQYPYSFGAGLKATAFCPWDMRFVVDFSFLGQRGYYYSELNRNYYVLNATISQPLWKKRLTLSLEAFDLLGQLPNLTRNFGAANRSITMYNGYVPMPMNDARFFDPAGAKGLNRTILLRLLYRFKIGGKK